MKKGFTIVEVSILFVIFLIVAFLVAPLSLDDTMQAKHTSRWRAVQADFSNILYSINSTKEHSDKSFKEIVDEIISNEIKADEKSYKITYLNGSTPKKDYQFDDYKITYSNAVIAVKFYETAQDDRLGIVMYDINGKVGPNVWGKDVYGFDVYSESIEPFGKRELVSAQKRDCSRGGTGLLCSNYYLIGGNFD